MLRGRLSFRLCSSMAVCTETTLAPAVCFSPPPASQPHRDYPPSYLSPGHAPMWTPSLRLPSPHPSWMKEEQRGKQSSKVWPQTRYKTPRLWLHLPESDRASSAPFPCSQMLEDKRHFVIAVGLVLKGSVCFMPYEDVYGQGKTPHAAGFWVLACCGMWMRNS